MDRDEFIITVHGLVYDPYRVIKDIYPLRRGGTTPIRAKIGVTY